MNKIAHWKSCIENSEASIRRLKMAIAGHEKEIRKERRLIEHCFRLNGHFRTQLKLEQQRQHRRLLRGGRKPLSMAA